MITLLFYGESHACTNSGAQVVLSSPVPITGRRPGIKDCRYFQLQLMRNQQEPEVDKLFVHIWKMIGQIHIGGAFHVCYVYKEALRSPIHTEVCIGLDIAHFPSLMYGFIIQQDVYIVYKHNSSSMTTQSRT